MLGIPDLILHTHHTRTTWLRKEILMLLPTLFLACLTSACIALVHHLLEQCRGVHQQRNAAQV